MTDHHLACLHLGAQKVSRERRRSRGRTERVLAFVDAIGEAAGFGLKEHDRLLLARSRMERALRGRRASSKLPALIELVLSRPLVTTAAIQSALKVSRQGALDLVGAFNLRELTGRGRYKGWGIG
ncbi:MAG: helix-turn-helix domain-containing protein [Rhizobiaceae bacterium]